MTTPEGMRIDEARERIDALERRLLMAEDQRDGYRSTLLRIVQSDDRDTKGDLVRAAKVVLNQMEQRYA